MNLIRKLMEADESKWLWFGGILIGSCLPMIIRFIISIDFQEISSFDIKDCLFAGIAINLSNINMVGIRDFRSKVSITYLSTISLVIIASCIAVFLMNEANPQQGLFGIKLISILVVIASTRISLFANHFSFK